jgi:hypothetical protein
MRVKRVLSVGKFDPAEKGIDLTRHLSGDERVSMVEDLRQQMAKVAGYEYPTRLKKVLQVCYRTTKPSQDGPG